MSQVEPIAPEQGEVAFEHFFNETIKPRAQKLDDKRRGIKRKAILIGVSVGVLGYLCVFAVTLMIDYMDTGDIDTHSFIAAGTLGLFGLVGAGGVFLHRYAYIKNNNFDAQYKREIVDPLVRAISPSLEYDPDGEMSLETVAQAPFFIPPTTITTDDYLEGTIDGQQVQIAEVQLEWEKENKRYNAYTGGIFVVVDTELDHEKEVRVFPELSKGGDQRRDGAAPILEAHDFEKQYEVRGDEVMARRVLTPRAMQSLIEVREYVGSSPYVGWAGGKVYLLLPYSRNLFEPTIFGALDTDYLHRTAYDIGMVVSVVRTLNETH